MKKRLNKKAGILIGLLVFPALLLLIVPRLMDKKFEVRHYEDELILSDSITIDTISTIVDPFSFTDQYGGIFSEKEVKGKMYVASFFFTNDNKVSRRMNSMLCRVHEYFRNNKNIMILSHTIDPISDSLETLQNYSEDYVTYSDTWKFLTGKKEEIYQTASKSYLLNVVKDGESTYNKMVTLVDEFGRVRGFYDASSFRDVSRLITEIRVLMQEDENK